MAVSPWLIDKSALARLGASADAEEWASRIGRGLVRITTGTRLEVGFSARSGPDLRAGLHQPPVSAMPVEYLNPAIEDRAVELQAALARPGAAPGSVDPGPDHRRDRRTRRADGAAPGQGLRAHRRDHGAARRAPPRAVSRWRRTAQKCRSTAEVEQHHTARPV